MKYQRKQKITQYLMQNGSASISELSKLCDISEMTVRRYLNELKEDIGIELKRGGAVYPFATGEIPFQYKSSICIEKEFPRLRRGCLPIRNRGNSFSIQIDEGV